MVRREQVVSRFDFSRRGPLTLAIVSDTHGETDERVCEVVAQCDVALHGGDIFTASVLEKMRPKTGEVIAVRGNNDTRSKWSREEYGILESLPDIVELQLPGGMLSMEHGHRIWDTRNYHRRLRLKHCESRLVVYGHTHKTCFDQSTLPWVLNPGAAGRIRTYGGASCYQLSVSEAGWALEFHQFPLQTLALTG